MSYSGDAAEQVVRMSLEGTEVAVKLAGSGAKQLAILLYAILREQTKTKGKTRLTNMLRSGKELKVFAVKDADLKQFCREAKKYGVLYCVLKDRDAKDGITDIMVRAEDASKVNRIFERFELSTVDMASVKQDIERDRAEKAGEDIPAPEQDTDAFLDELLAPPPEQEGELPAPERTTPEQDKDDFLSEVLGGAKEGEQPENPTEGRSAKSRQSEPISKRKEQAAPGISEPPSVRRELDEIKAEQKAKAAEKEKSPPQKSARHKASPKKKTQKRKER